MIGREVDRDPLHFDQRRRAHLFLAAEPLEAEPDLLLEFLEGVDVQGRLATLVQSPSVAPNIEQALQAGHVGAFHPDFGTLQFLDRRTDGVALTSYQLGPGRVPRSDITSESEIVELGLREGGGIRLYMSRLSDKLASRFSPEKQLSIIFEAALLTYTRRLIGLVGEICRRTEYTGSWALAVAANGLSGVSSYHLSQESVSEPTPYTDDLYRQAHVVGSAELMARPGTTAKALVGRLLRSLGTAEYYAGALEDSGQTVEELGR